MYASTLTYSIPLQRVCTKMKHTTYICMYICSDQCICVLIITIVLYKCQTTKKTCIKMNSVLNSSQQIAIQQRKTHNLRKSNTGI